VLAPSTSAAARGPDLVVAAAAAPLATAVVAARRLREEEDNECGEEEEEDGRGEDRGGYGREGIGLGFQEHGLGEPFYLGGFFWIYWLRPHRQMQVEAQVDTGPAEVATSSPSEHWAPLSMWPTVSNLQAKTHGVKRNTVACCKKNRGRMDG
jgi:hypothetical protein